MKKIYGIWILLCLLSAQASAQFTWKSAGPDNIGSKTRAIVVDGNKVVAGSAGGGLWVSEDGGVSWKVMQSYADAKCSPVVSAIAKDGSNWYVGTGEFSQLNGARQANAAYNFENDSTGFLGYIGTPGSGVCVSTDNGASWSFQNATTQGTFGSQTLDYRGPFTSVNKILVHSSGRIYVATHRGLFYTDDNFTSIDTVKMDLDTTVVPKRYKPGPGGVQKPRWPVFSTGTFYDLEEGANGVVYASCYALTTEDPTRIAWMLRTTENSDKGSALRPVLLGTDSIRVNGALVKIGRGGRRVELAVAPSDKNYLYVAGLSQAGELSGVWRTTDGAQNWSIAAPQGNPGFTPLALRDNNYFTFVLSVSPTDPNSLVVAGNAWYSYTPARGWTQTAQSSNPNSFTYNFVPNSIYCIAYNPANSEEFYVGTDKQVVKYMKFFSATTNSELLGFRQRTKGYEGALCVSVASMNIITNDENDPENVVKDTIEAVLTGTSNNGILFNKFFAKEGYFAQKGFGRVNANNWSNIEVSSLYPGNLVAQRSDQGLERSPNYGQSYASFYGPFIKTKGTYGNVFGMTARDSLIDRDKPNPGANDPKGSLRDFLASNGYRYPNQSQFVLDEVIPDNLLDKGKDALQTGVDDRIYFCSGKYLWVVNYPFRDSTKWNRVTNELTSGGSTITAIAASNDSNHDVYVGTSNGELYRVTKVNDLVNFKITPPAGTQDSNVVRIHVRATGLPARRWISSIAVDPNNTKRVIVTYATYGRWSSMSKGKMICVTDDITAANPVFKAVGDALPAKLNIFSSKVVNDPATNTSVLLVGTEKGLYSSRDWGTSYQAENETELGNVPVTDIYVRKYNTIITNANTKDFKLVKDNTIFIATQGRGVFYTGALRFPRTGNEVEDEVITKTDLKLYPNPTDGVLHLELALVKDTKLQVALMGTDGRLIASLEAVELEKGRKVMDFNTQSLAPGVYLLQVNTTADNQTKSETLKFVVGK